MSAFCFAETKDQINEKGIDGDGNNPIGCSGLEFFGDHFESLKHIKFQDEYNGGKNEKVFLHTKIKKAQKFLKFCALFCICDSFTEIGKRSH